LSVNIRAQIVLGRAEVKAMLASKRESDTEPKGAIVHCGSVLSHVAMTGGAAAYVVAKHAVAGLTKSMGSAYGKLGIRTNAVAPG
jgi:3-oxoacyl-[acyl-carrier protein] reductase